MPLKSRIAPILLASFLLAACGAVRAPFRAPALAPGGQQFGQFSSNGQQIYFTATDQSGQRISYTGGPGFGGMMMGAYLVCADCHGADARGGVHYIHMQSVDAPAIYYDALVEMLQEDLGGTPHRFPSGSRGWEGRSRRQPRRGHAALADERHRPRRSSGFPEDLAVATMCRRQSEGGQQRRKIRVIE